MNLLRRIAGLLSTAAFVCSLSACGTSPEKETRELARDVGAIRRTEARLSGFDEWAEWSGPAPISETAKLSVLKSQERIQRDYTGSGEPGWYAALGVRYLLLGNVPKAISLLESSRAINGKSASLLNDLAAAALAQATVSGNAAQLAYALDLAEAAARENPRLLAARFNRALILEKLGPPSRAAQAWRDYLTADASSGWAKEATARRDRLDAIVKQKTEQAKDAARLGRESVEAQLFTWANAVVNGDQSGAARALAAADASANEIRARDKNTYPAGLIADLRRHVRAGREKQFALAFIAATEGDKLITNLNDSTGAKARFAAALLLTQPGGTFWDYLTYRQLHAPWLQGDMKAQERRARKLIADAGDKGLQLVVARSQMVLGSILQRLASFSDAVESYKQAIAGLESIKEYAHVASARALLAAALREHAMWQDAWTLESQALSDYDLLPQPPQRHTVLHEATRLAIARQQTDLAARFQGFLAEQAVEWKSPGAIGIAAANAARVHLQRGQPAAAAAEHERAEQTLSQEQDKRFRDSYQLEMLTLRTEVQIQTAPQRALETAHLLIQSLGQGEALFRRVRAYRLLGQAALRAGKQEEAITAWRQGIDALEADNLTAREEQLRIARTSDVWAIYDDLTSLLVQRSEWREALDISERGRARSLAYSLAPERITIDASLGRDATILYYTLLANRTLIWVLDGQEIIFLPTDGGTRLVNPLANELRAMAASNADAAPVLRRLYSALIAPVASALRGRERLVIVPDGAMSAVPFAALVSPDNGRLILDDHEVQIAPSLTMVKYALEHPNRDVQPARVLAVGAPAASEGLPALPGALSEVKGIAALFPNTQPLLDDTLSVPKFLSEVKRNDVVHFAGHAVENREFPSRSFLAMSGSERLTPDRIQKPDFEHVRLLVLSACSTAEGAVERGEGVMSLARPFLAAGVRQVLATVSTVDDEIAPLLVEFHQKLKAGATPASALRSVQIDAYKRDRKISLRGWAAFELFGVTASR